MPRGRKKFDVIIEEPVTRITEDGDPAAAAKDKSGAVEATKPAPKERSQGDYIPVIAVLVGVGLLAMAFLRPQPIPSLARFEPPSNEGQDQQNYGTDWQQTGQDY
jgi:hypothetical protein